GLPVPLRVSPLRIGLLRPALLLGALAALLAGCAGNVGYLAQTARGHLQIMGEREDIADVVADPATDPQLRSELETATAILDFAATELALPDNGSYRDYVDIGRPYVVVNVVATPELSLDPLTWCFPIAGCVSYRGYFDVEDARTFGHGLADEGYDVTLSPA